MVFTKRSLNKKKGNEGERLVDAWMVQQGWRALVSNHFFRGGEIDRVYLKLLRGLRHACVAEVKTVWIESAADLPRLFTEVELRRFLRPSQMKNLYRFGERLLAPEGWFHCRASSVYLRVFLVVKFQAQDGLRSVAVPGAKCVFCSGQVHIYALVPEFVASQQRTTSLQIPLR